MTYRFRFLLGVAMIALALFVHAPHARAQFSPNTVLTATALNNALAAPAITGGSINGSTSITTNGAVTLSGTGNLGALTNATTQGYTDNSTLVATSQFVKRTLLAATATIPIPVTGGTYNFATAGSGAIFAVTTSSGALASITSIVAGGTGYQVGDCLTMVSGNGDAIVYVNTVSSGVITAATVLYGGTGYSGSPQISGAALPPGSRSGNITGTLASNATIIIPSGTLLAGARRIGFQNNTTGAFTVSVKLSNGTGGSTGTGVVLPQGTANNTSVTLYTNGTTDVWNEVSGTSPTYTNAGVVIGGMHAVQGQATTAANTATVTFTNAAVFTSATSYICTAADTSATGGAPQITQNSGTSVTFTTAGMPAAHVLNFRCAGN
ncbi:MAG TPA: hypothetical protein VN289_19620 [Paraburkholderia sp.]|nr:hypothetical protein [Paraburkholderia sp.]